MGAEQSFLSITEPVRKQISFLINGQVYHASPDVGIGPDTLLVDYIRDNAHLKGTKYMCREGGCGACLVSVKTRNPHTGEETIRAVNSCLTPIYSCDGWEITTIESLGNKKIGYHVIQQRIAQFSGTQCGFCTSGQIMNMYSLKESKPELYQVDIEDIMDCNICRCTGYRPILDAFKSLAKDAPEELKRKCGEFPFKTNEKCWRTRNSSETSDDFEFLSGQTNSSNMSVALMNFKELGIRWLKTVDLQSLFMAIDEFQKTGISYKIVAGNTGTGVYKEEGPYQAFIDINSIHVLTKVDVSSSNLILGGAVTITRGLEALQKAGMMSDDYKYAEAIRKHWKRVANVGVRNLGTLGGNLMLKHQHREFYSDIFLILECIGAMLTIASAVSLQTMYTLEQFMEMDMAGKVIVSIHFPKLTGILRTFKIARRYQNSSAYVNAAFLMNIDQGTVTVKEEPRIVYGGISPTFIHARETEKYLNGKTLDAATLQEAMKTLDKEINPVAVPHEAEPMYRKTLTQSLLYKAVLGLVGDSASAHMKSGSTDIERGLSYGKQTYETEDKTEWPIYEPIKKLEAALQCSGEAEYVDDIEPLYGELHGAMVLSKQGLASLKSVDASEAMKMPGVRGFVSAKDITGENSYGKFSMNGQTGNLVFAEGKVNYAGEVIGLVVADSRPIALKAAKLVKIEYADIQKPIIDIPTALEKLKLQGKWTEDEQPTVYSSEPKPQAGEPFMKIQGEFSTGGQHHFHMESQICICVPKEDSMEVYSSTQNMSHVQNAVGTVVGIPLSSVTVYVKRLGGAFGAKLMKSSHVAAACAVAAHTFNRPVRLNLDMETNLSAIGRRLAFLFKYEVNVDENGKILELNLNLTGNNGQSDSEPTHFFGLLGIQNAYAANGWKVIPGYVKTNTTPNTLCRAPGIPPAVGCIEYIMEHIAWAVKKDPVEVRMVNLLQKGDSYFPIINKKMEYDTYVPRMMDELKVSADLEDRQKFIGDFNKANRWKKRGMAIVPTKVGVHLFRSNYKTYIACYWMDGTVAISHSGIEMGQGINTKVAQVVARRLNLPMDKIKVKPANSLLGANAGMTGLSITSEFMCHSAIKACDILLERLAPVKEKLGGSPTWMEIMGEARNQFMDLTAQYVTTPADGLKDYECWGLTASEVEIDCLTGETKIVRVDILNDSGFSINPDVDIGQIEGAFVMSCGLWLTEKVSFDENTAQIMNNRTWNYKPPLPKDIPEHFRITLLKNVPNPYGVLRSKACAEPPISMGCSVFLAVQKAIAACRADAGNTDWFPMRGPVTPEDIQRLCLIDPSQFVIN